MIAAFVATFTVGLVFGLPMVRLVAAAWAAVDAGAEPHDVLEAIFS